MSKPIRCATCGDFVGVSRNLFVGGMKSHRPCPGKGNHAKPLRTETIRGFWWWKVKEVTQLYPETNTQSSWKEKLVNGKWESVR